MTKKDVDKIIDYWSSYFGSVTDWQQLTKEITPKATGCGPVYELPRQDRRLHGSSAIADMRNIPFTEPHYHTNDETEIYFGLSGSGKVVVGGRVVEIEKGSIIVTPPDTAHFTIPGNNLVLGVVNTPLFRQANQRDLTDSDPTVCFDRQQFLTLTNQTEEK